MPSKTIQKEKKNHLSYSRRTVEGALCFKANLLLPGYIQFMLPDLGDLSSSRKSNLSIKKKKIQEEYQQHWATKSLGRARWCNTTETSNIIQRRANNCRTQLDLSYLFRSIHIFSSTAYQLETRILWLANYGWSNHLVWQGMVMLWCDNNSTKITNFFSWPLHSSSCYTLLELIL